MKKVFITLFCLSLGTASLYAQANKPAATATPAAKQTVAAPQTAVKGTPAPAAAPDPDAPKFKFKKGDTHDFGEVPEGPVAEYKFEFKNDGNKPLIIQEAHGSCGCTVPSFSKEPVLPGKKSEITVKYNTQGRPGPIHKEVFIKSNAEPSTYTLHITGTVKVADKPAATPPAPKKS